MKLTQLLLLALAALSLPSARADDPPAPEIQLDLKRGPCKGALGDVATIDVPEGYVFVEKKDMPRFLELTQNLPSDDMVGALLPAGEEEDWVIWFSYDPVGFVKDDDKSKLDAAKMLEAMQEGQEEANAERKKRGWGETTLEGWVKEPFYDTQTHRLTWGLKLHSKEGGEWINYNSRLLGRRGYVSANLAVSPAALEAVTPRYNQLLTAFAYPADGTYQAFTSGDKVAEFGLVALVAGGAGVAAAKMGLFAKLGKFIAAFFKIILVGVVGAGVAIKKFFFGEKKSGR